MPAHLHAAFFGPGQRSQRPVAAIFFARVGGAALPAERFHVVLQNDGAEVLLDRRAIPGRPLIGAHQVFCLHRCAESKTVAFQSDADLRIRHRSAFGVDHFDSDVGGADFFNACQRGRAPGCIGLTARIADVGARQLCQIKLWPVIQQAHVGDFQRLLSAARHQAGVSDARLGIRVCRKRNEHRLPVAGDIDSVLTELDIIWRLFDFDHDLRAALAIDG